MGDVLDVDFGKEKNETVRRFCRLSGILEEYAADVLRDPIKYLEQSNAEISALRRQIRDAKDTLRAPMPTFDSSYAAHPVFETIVVPKDEYERLRACADLIFKL